MAKAKTSTPDTVIIETEIGQIEVPRDSQILVIKTSEINVKETDEQWPHDYAATVVAQGNRLDPMEIEAGASLILAGLWADHIDAKSPGLVHLMDTGSLVVYPSAALAFKALPVSKLRAVIARTRHGYVLRQWEAIEQDGQKPRQVVLKDLRSRLRLFRDHAPLEYEGFASSLPKPPQPAEVAPS